MTEILYDCELWKKTADLAKDRGFNMSDKCPMISVCSGERCAFIDPITKLSQEDAINTEQKLQTLREELKQRTDAINTDKV
jgi:hypothetical protein